jgi:acetyl esterase/lipase
LVTVAIILHDAEGEVVVASKQLKHMNELYASIKERYSKPDIDLATIRDIVENLHLAATEPEAVTYAEVDAGGVPALWCIPAGYVPDRVLLHSHAGGTVVTTMHTDRKALGHIAKAVGVRALVVNYRRSPEHKFPAQIDDLEKAYRWLLARGIRPENIASIGHSIGGNLAVSLAVTLRDKGAPLPAAILSVSPWYDMEMKNETLESNAATPGRRWKCFESRGSATQGWPGMIPGSICSTLIYPGFHQSWSTTAPMRCWPAKPSSSRSERKTLASMSPCIPCLKASTISS